MKTVLVEKKSKIVERTQSVAVGSDYVPMSVWEARGWKKEDVLSFNDWEELANGTPVYRCHIKSKTDAENKRTVGLAGARARSEEAPRAKGQRERKDAREARHGPGQAGVRLLAGGDGQRDGDAEKDSIDSV